VKNSDAEKTDNPRTSRAALVALHTRWLTAAGASVAPGTPVEINPLFAGNVAELRRKIAPGTKIDQPTYFAPNGPRVV
jgi:UDP-N-acetylglucosamine/UDP-N-acetylgalactosamine diphosphorylase